MGTLARPFVSVASSLSVKGARRRVVADRGEFCSDGLITPLPASDGGFTVLSDKGAYSGATAYVAGDLVLNASIYYVAKGATTGNAPPNATYWYPITTSATYACTFTLKAPCTDVSAFYAIGSNGAGSFYNPAPADIQEFRATIAFGSARSPLPLQGIGVSKNWYGFLGPRGDNYRAGETMSVRTYVRVLPTDKFLYTVRMKGTGDRTTDPNQCTGGDYTDQTTATTTGGVGTLKAVTSTNSLGLGPQYITGVFTETTPLVACLAGDSIANGAGPSGGKSYAQQALEAAGWLCYKCAHGGSNSTSNRQFAIIDNLMSEFCDYVFVHCGTNDINGTMDGPTHYNNQLLYWAALSKGGKRPIVASTILPRTGSYDAWATAANQGKWGAGITNITNNGSGLMRLTTAAGTTQTGDQITLKGITGTGNIAALNGQTFTATAISSTVVDLQGSTFGGTYTSGGTYDNATREAVRLYTNGKMRDGSAVADALVLGFSLMVIDPCAQTEVNSSNVPTQNGGYWLTTGVASAATADGIHPKDPLTTPAMAAVVAARFPLYE